MDEGSVKSLPIVLIFLLLLSIGVGGYYLGKYIDTQVYEAEKAKNPAVDLSSKVVSYRNDELKVKLEYPGDWGILVYEPKDSDLVESFEAMVVSLTSPNGSQFIVTKQTMVTELLGYTERCDSKDPNGNERENKKCTFVEGGPTKFARYVTEDPRISPGWNVAELGDEESNPDVYLFSPANSVQFFVEKDSDLVILDKIMKSFERLQ